MFSAISIQNLVKKYKNTLPNTPSYTTEALKGISFDIAEGEFFGFLGPNGAGKTTTINLITGLANMTSGSISVFGKDVVKEYQETRRMIGLAAQEPNFDPFFPLHKVLVFQAGYHGMPKREAKDRVALLLKRFGLWEHRGKTPREISGGMKRRLLIAKALVHNPKILILDEPTAGVDVELRHDLWKFLSDLNREGKTILLTTHYIEEAEHLCNRIGIIHNGEMKTVEEKQSLMNKLAEKKVIMHFKEIPATLRSEIERLPGIHLQENKIYFATEHIDAHLKKISALIDAHHLEIEDVDVHEYDLEDIFLQLTDLKK